MEKKYTGTYLWSYFTCRRKKINGKLYLNSMDSISEIYKISILKLVVSYFFLYKRLSWLLYGFTTTFVPMQSVLIISTSVPEMDGRPVAKCD